MPAGVRGKFSRTISAEPGVFDFAGAEGIHHDGNRLGYADGVGQLHFGARGQTGRDDVLGDIAGHVAGGAVYFRGVLAGEGAAAVTAHAAVGIDDDLAAGKAGVAMRSADDETAGGIDVELGMGIDHAGRNDRVDDVFPDVGFDLRRADIIAVLGGDDDGIDALGAAVDVFDADLAFAVGAEVGHFAAAARFAQPADQAYERA